MSVDTALQEALTPLGPPVYPNKYTGGALEYIVTNWTMIPALHAGDRARAARYLVQVHYYLPDKQNPNAMLTQICRALVSRRFTCSSIVPVEPPGGGGETSHGQHYAVECEYFDGGVGYGDC